MGASTEEVPQVVVEGILEPAILLPLPAPDLIPFSLPSSFSALIEVVLGGLLDSGPSLKKTQGDASLSN